MRRDISRVVKISLLGLLSVLVVFTVSLSIETDSLVIPEIKEQKPVAIGMSSKILMTGEVFWGRYARDAALASEEGYGYPFSGLSTFDRDKYNAWFAQLECPITDNNLTSKEQEATLTFNCRPEFLKEASKWFDAFSLANNHTDNMGGQAGLDETRSYLVDNGIQYYGHFENSVVDDLCEVVSLPVEVSYLPISTTKEEFPVAMCGYHNVFKLPTSDQLDVIKQYSKYFLTIISPHMGEEYVASADQFKTDTYRGMIDRGADLVVASHPHWVQNTEVYKDKLIMYSVGNFMFDQQQDAEVRRSAALDIEISVSDRNKLARWLSVDLACAEFKDDCLERAKLLKLEKPNFTLSYKIIPSLNTNYVTSLAPPDTYQSILVRLNWEQTAKQLSADNNLLN